MGLKRRLSEYRRHQIRDNPGSVRLIACVLCRRAAGQKFTSPIKKIKDPILLEKTGHKVDEQVYYHMKGCPQ